ncbi:MAG: prenyltransferase [Sulfolobales archaeon]
MNKIRAVIDLMRPATSLTSLLASIAGSLVEGNPFNEVSPSILALLYLGVFLSHSSVNVFNDYFDYKSGLDLVTSKTPFSGGSKVIVEKRLSEREALALGLILLVFSASIGLYLTLARGLLVLIFMVVGALIIILYTKILVKHLLGEFSVYVKSVLITLASSYVVFGDLTLRSLLIGSLYGIVSLTVLFLNSIPDRDVDRMFYRRTIASVLPVHRLHVVYALLIIFTFLNTLLISIQYSMGVLLIFSSTPIFLLMLYVYSVLKFVLDRGFPQDLNDLIGVLGFNILSHRLLEFLVVFFIFYQLSIKI